MTSKLLVSLGMTLVILTQLARTHGLSTVSTQSDGSAVHSHTSKNHESSYLYFFGGYTALSESFLNSTSRLSTATGEWKSMNDMPTTRTNFCGAVVSKKIYLFGGERKADHYESGTSEMTPNVVYDCLADTYTPLPPMPDYERLDCAAAALGQSIYVSGGTEPWVNHSTSDLHSFHRFDTRTNQWTPLAPMNSWRSGHQLIELGGLLYAIGGDFNNNGTEVYNATTNKWSQLAGTDYRKGIVSGSASSAHEGKIYAFGLHGFEVYSPETNQWTNLPHHNDVEVFSGKLVSMNGKLWSVGGVFENLHSYDPSTGQWTKERKIDVERTSGFSAFVVNF